LPSQAIPYILLLGFLFGSNLITSRFSVGQFHPMLYVGLRMGLASLGYLAFYLLGRRKWPRERRLWGHAAVLGLFGTAMPMLGIVSSLQYQSSGVTAVLITLGPAFTVLLAHFFLPDEVLTRRKAIGVLLAFSGGLILAIRGESGLPDVARANPIGYGLVILSMIFGSGTTVYARRFMQDLDEFNVASVRVFVATLAVLPATILHVGVDLRGVDGMGFFALGYASVAGTFLAMLLSFTVIRRFGATASAMTSYVVPVFSSLGGMFLLGERITLTMLMGMALIAFGLSRILSYARSWVIP
jgi:drug/metabolite transporter (DMT)-like permease